MNSKRRIIWLQAIFVGLVFFAVVTPRAIIDGRTEFVIIPQFLFPLLGLLAFAVWLQLRKKK
jgi:hypothetical protein